MNFNLDQQSRKELFDVLLPLLEDYYAFTKTKTVSANWDIQEIRALVQQTNFQQPASAISVINQVVKGLDKYAVHTPHPNYFGLFNPRTSFTSILADLIVATFNPQLAAWSHAPYASEIETYIIQEFGKKFGYKKSEIDGTFCTGGAESNLTAIICALNQSIPNFSESGLVGISKIPIIYCSSESHHSIIKAAKITGLGSQSVRSIPVNSSLGINVEALRATIIKDRQEGYQPLMIVGTAGTTGAGGIDDLTTIHQIAKDEQLWYHVDAAYGGAVVLSEKYKSVLAGIELSDSITLDLHKWLSIPMGASLFLTNHKNILHQSFSIKTKYMPEDGDPNQIVDPYVHSIQWSRRFIGLKMYLPLAIHGWEGFEQVINHQIEMGVQLKNGLLDRGWEIKNNSPLPIVCFSRKGFHGEEIIKLVDAVNESGKAWVSVYPIHQQSTARACITNYATGQQEVEELITVLSENLEGKY